MKLAYPEDTPVPLIHAVGSYGLNGCAGVAPVFDGDSGEYLLALIRSKLRNAISSTIKGASGLLGKICVVIKA